MEKRAAARRQTPQARRGCHVCTHPELTFVSPNAASALWPCEFNLARASPEHESPLKWIKSILFRLNVPLIATLYMLYIEGARTVVSIHRGSLLPTLKR